MKIQFLVTAALTASIPLFAQEAHPAASMPTVPAVPAETPVAVMPDAKSEVVLPPEAGAVDNADLTVKVDETLRTDDPESLLAKKFEEFRIEKQKTNAAWDWGTPIPGTQDVYMKAEWAVDLDSTQPEFIKARWFAFEKAYTRAVADYIIDTYGKFVGQTISSEFGDDSTGAEDLTVRPSATLAQKIDMLAEAKVDKALANEGVPESQYKGKDLVAKRVLAQDVLKKSAAKKAIRESSGCIPIKTFEAYNDKTYRIGVIIKVGPQCKSLSKCFRMKKPPVLTKEGKSWAELRPTDAGMLQEFGVRLYFDETGMPSLLSYGQFGTSYTGKNNSMRERFERQAKHQATMLADSKISEFINSMMDVTDESPDLGMELEDAISAFSDDTRSREDKLNILDVFRKGFKMTTNMDMAGITTVYGPQMIRHPSGHRVAVVVRRWSFAQVDAIREMERKEKETDKRGGVLPPPQPRPVKGGAGVRSGATYDF